MSSCGLYKGVGTLVFSLLLESSVEVIEILLLVTEDLHHPTEALVELADQSVELGDSVGVVSNWLCLTSGCCILLLLAIRSGGLRTPTTFLRTVSCSQLPTGIVYPSRLARGRSAAGRVSGATVGWWRGLPAG